MLGLTTQRERHLVDREGFVGCPVREQDVDVERCMACPLLDSFEQKPGDVRAVVCRVAHSRSLIEVPR